MLCSNGHEQPPSADRFCIFCGVELQRASKQKQSAATTKAATKASAKQTRPQIAMAPPPQLPPPTPSSCKTCGGDGRRLNTKAVICEECNWLRPLVTGYQLDTASFEWAADGKAMSVLRSITPLQVAAKTVSEKVGRRWIESTFNGVLLGPTQLPEIYGQAVRAARLLGLSHMPDVYLSGERPWDCLTFGTDKDSFIVIGSALAGSFRGPEMLFLLAREIGHCRAGHALWKSVIRFFLGEQGPAKGFMAGGILAAISPSALLSGAIEMPLLAWARQAEITADRAGLLAIGDEQIARRVLLTWTLKSAFMFRQINIDAWLEQQSELDDGYKKLTELTTTSTPYITPRLQLLAEFAKSRELQYWRKFINDSIGRGKAQLQPKPPAPKAVEDVIRIKCSSCQTPMRIPRSVLEGKDVLPVKCPNAKCGKITRLKKQVKAVAKAIPKPGKTVSPPAKKRADAVNKKRVAGEDARGPKTRTKKTKRTEEDMTVGD